MGSKYAFSDRLLFSDESVYRNLGFRHVPEEETAADNKAIDLLNKSPYKENLATPGLFLRELANLGTGVSALCTPHLGRSFMDNKGRVTRMVALMNAAPVLNRDGDDHVRARKDAAGDHSIFSAYYPFRCRRQFDSNCKCCADEPVTREITKAAT